MGKNSLIGAPYFNLFLYIVCILYRFANMPRYVHAARRRVGKRMSNAAAVADYVQAVVTALQTLSARSSKVNSAPAPSG